MLGLNLIPPLMRTVMAMLVVGGLMGYAGTGFITTLVADSGVLGGGGESSPAHKCVMAIVQRDSASTRLCSQSPLVQRALQQQNASQQVMDAKPLTLTYLGNGSTGRISVHIYAVEIQAGGGQYQFFPLALTIVGGRVVRVD
jgi:hypothetical protein